MARREKNSGEVSSEARQSNGARRRGELGVGRAEKSDGENGHGAGCGSTDHSPDDDGVRVEEKINEGCFCKIASPTLISDRRE